MCFHARVFFFFKQKTAYEMRISDWSSDVCSSDLASLVVAADGEEHCVGLALAHRVSALVVAHDAALGGDVLVEEVGGLPPGGGDLGPRSAPQRGEIGRASCRERVCQYV